MITIRTFARYREILGFDYLEIKLPLDKKLKTILKDPIFLNLPNDALFAVNKRFSGRDTKLKNGDQIAIMPQVSGG